MSIVAEVVKLVAETKGDFIVKNIPELENTIEQSTKELKTHIEDVYLKYCRMSDINSALLNKAVNCQIIMKDLQEKADAIKDKQLNIENVTDNIKKLQILEVKTKYLTNIISILNLFNEFDKEATDGNYLKCASIVNQLEDTILSIPSDDVSTFEIIEGTLRNKKFILKESMHNLFKNNMEINDSSKESTVILQLKKYNKEMEEIILALYLITERVEPLHTMAKQLWFQIFTPIVNNEIDLSVKEKTNSISLELTQKSTNKSHYTVVFNNLQTVLDVLKTHFPYKVNDEMTAMEYIGNDIRDNLSELLIKNCLRDTIPSDEEGLKQYEEVQEATLALEKSLLEAHLFDATTKSIFSYANNVDILFINNKCKQYLEQAMEIMKKDLHDIVEVGVADNVEYFSAKTVQEFPRCSISKNVEELLTFCAELLIKACNSDARPESAGRLFVTVTTIISSYRTYVPEHHKSYLTTLPQQIAVFMNNCYYISHTLIGWETKYCAKLKPILDQCNFVKEIQSTSTVGKELFGKYLCAQMKQVEDIMDGAELNVGLTIEKLSPLTEKCIRQCLRQQELLRTVWHKVLSHETYNKNIGLVVNTLCNCIVTAVVKFEDISAQAAEQLVDVIKLILTRAPKLFTDSKEILLYVSLWNKLNELSFVLSASLVDISDRWASGKGPLALYFEAAELVHLIKALFQNTDRRAEVLNKIV